VGYAGLEVQVDLQIARKVEDGDIRALMVTPPLVAQFKTLSNRDSDVELARMEKQGESHGNEAGLTMLSFQNSARKNLRDWIRSL
jgi:hypothetical protein